MATIEDELAKDTKWNPSSDGDVIHAPIGRHLDRDLVVVVRKLNNGLLYALPKDTEGRDVFRLGSYNVDNVPELPNQYHLINFLMRDAPPALYSTFEWKSERVLEGNPIAWLEYTMMHTPFFGNREGLTMLMSLYATQLVKGNWLDLKLNLPTKEITQRYHTATLEYSGEKSGGFYYHADGKQDPKSLGFSNLPMNIEGPLGKVFYDALRGARMDTLRTAENLVQEFPSLRPVHIQHV